MVADGLADQQTAGVLERLTNLFPARDLTNAGMSGVVLENHEIAGEKRPVRPAEIKQHAVATGDGNHLKLGYQGRGHSCSPLSLIHISEPTRLLSISYAVFCLKKK